MSQPDETALTVFAPATSVEKTAGGDPAMVSVALTSGHAVEIDPERCSISIGRSTGESRAQDVELVIQLSGDGITLSMKSHAVAIRAPQVSIRGEDVAIEASRELQLRSGGDVVVEADRGDVVMRANDNVRVVGERILLNSETEKVPIADQLAAFWRSLGIHQ